MSRERKEKSGPADVESRPGPPLFQESLRDDPLWMLVACVLVNRAKWDAAEPIHAALRAKYVTPLSLAQASVSTLAAVVKPLGLAQSRAKAVRNLAAAWVISPPKTGDDVERIDGLGKYAGDSWRIFVEGRRDVEATDGRLKWYLEREAER